MPKASDTPTRRGRVTTDALKILGPYFQGRPERLRALAEVRLNAAIAQAIYDLRTRAGLTQKQLAHLVNRRLEIRFVPLRTRRRVPARRSAVSAADGLGALRR